MLPYLENIPKSPLEWAQFSFDHRDSHDRIRQAILQKYKVDLNDRVIDPINPDNVQQFLENNATLHSEMNSILGLQSNNLEDVDLSNDKELQAWIALHYTEHFFAEQKLFAS